MVTTTGRPGGHKTRTRESKSLRHSTPEKLAKAFASWWNARHTYDSRTRELRDGINWLREALEERRPISRVSHA